MSALPSLDLSIFFVAQMQSGVQGEGIHSDILPGETYACTVPKIPNIPTLSFFSVEPVSCTELFANTPRILQARPPSHSSPVLVSGIIIIIGCIHATGIDCASMLREFSTPLVLLLPKRNCLTELASTAVSCFLNSMSFTPIDSSERLCLRSAYTPCSILRTVCEIQYIHFGTAQKSRRCMQRPIQTALLALLYYVLTIRKSRKAFHK
ncbi:hypothetical protein BCR34DRAFT_551847 [Clohesyomyces aquaticus]|uniref:Uncharacterized protein n=1 Tax=Clohesyomyces aquaticus TaxID=1231657 RepID=A0A1Y2ABI4_9PLEO|nr:hypothetical protein BCR34DRAFT_551847 [Clohesyomyces aquaticus]